MVFVSWRQLTLMHDKPEMLTYSYI